MARELKEIICGDIEARYRDLDGCVLIDFRGIDSEQTADLRSALRESGVRMNVIRNRLAKRVFEELGVPREFIDLIDGPTAVLFGGDGAFTASKGLAKWRDKHKDLGAPRGGLFLGQALSTDDVQRLADIPEPEVLRANICGLFMSPLTHMSSCAQSLLGHMAGCVKARREELDAGASDASGGEGDAGAG